MTQEELTDLVAAAVGRTPQWVRHDLSATDASLRERAEETLAAMIVASLLPDAGLVTEGVH
ncbi:MAG: hypothetical protein DI547_14265 [Sphingobium sp.]|jgi:hypothetical protein|nr:MAG: hypothetical protein DI547_14265 [Sphingobium sp.]